MSTMRARALALVSVTLIALALTTACASPPVSSAAPGKKTIVVTYAVLGAVVKELAGDAANVIVPMPNGRDPHDWEPSAKDIEAFNKANLIVQNGLGLEGGLEKTLAQAKLNGVHLFTASDHIAVRTVMPGEARLTGDPDQAVGAPDPHLWMDPLTMKLVVDALAPQLKNELGIDVAERASELNGRLDKLNQEIVEQVAGIPPENRKLVTGHESLGYFAERYGFKLIGAIIPSLSTQAQAAAYDLATLKKQIQENQVKAVFAEQGTPAAVTNVISQEAGVKVVQLTTHSLPPDGSYLTFMRNIARVITDALK